MSTLTTTGMTRDINLTTATSEERLAWYNENSGHSKPYKGWPVQDRKDGGLARCLELYNVLKPQPTPEQVKAAKAQKALEARIEREVAKKLKEEAAAPKEVELVKDGVTGKRYVSKTAPDSKYHLRDRSEAPKPVAVVRAICEDNVKLSRKDIIALCLEAGVNKNTAATQYSLWKSKRDTSFPGHGDEEGED